MNTRFYRHSLVAMKFAEKNHIPCITIEHGTSHLSVNNKVLDYFGSLYEHALTMLDKKHCDNYYGVSLACNDWLKHFHIKAKGVLYNSIDVHEVEDVIKISVRIIERNIPFQMMQLLSLLLEDFFLKREFLNY